MEPGIGGQAAGLAWVDESPLVSSPAASAAADTLPWREAAMRVRRYWQALGVSDDRQLGSLTQVIMDRLNVQAAEGAADDLARLGVKAVQDMINTWLADRLGIDPQPGELGAARTALLCGAMADWPGRLLNPQPHEEAVAARLRELMAQPTPPEEKLVMAEQRIELRSLSLLTVFRRLCGFLKPGAAKPSANLGGKQ